MTSAAVNLFGTRIGVVTVDSADGVPVFQYTPEFARTSFQVSPVMMPLRAEPYRFPGLRRTEAFRGLPGLLADSLPDRWGNALIDAWLDAQGRDPGSVDVVERLCYVGVRGMGALEFEPAVDIQQAEGRDLHVDALVELASEVLVQREQFVAELAADPDEAQMQAILAIGTSAGGARPKAIIAYDEATGRVRSGQVDAGPGFEHWLLKFDGVARAGDHGMRDPRGWGAVEYAYSKMAQAAGIEMAECRLLEENGRRHFMTRRFDRPEEGGKLHMQTVAALEHVDYDAPGIYSYERALGLVRKLGLDTSVVEQLYRRMAFNLIARNQDDHVKNISFLMGRDGAWELAPAYDITFAFHPGNRWLESHQMTMAGKRDDFTQDDLQAVAKQAGLVRGRWRRIVSEIAEVVSQWPQIADQVGVDPALRDRAQQAHRLSLAGDPGG